MSVEMVEDFIARRWAYEARGAIIFDASTAPADIYVSFWKSFEPVRSDPRTRDFAIWVPHAEGDPTPWGTGVFTENGLNLAAVIGDWAAGGLN
jgi:cysteinyl-tRNA synthetase